MWRFLVLMLGLSGAAAQVATAPAKPQANVEEVNRREAMLKPGLEALKAGDFTAASDAFRGVLVSFPEDARILSLLATSAERAGHDEEALGFYERALSAHAVAPWPMRLSVLQLQARLGRWPDFDRGLAALRAAKKSGTDHALDSSNGFRLETFDAGGKQVQSVVFPLGVGEYHTLYRFLLPKQTAITGAMASTNSPQSSRCDNPNFQPYLAVESDDVDQGSFAKAHPDLAAKGERSYSLDTYSSPCSQGLIKFYKDGEPPYEQVRADVIKALSAGGKQGRF